jgi:hypothetical protein
VVTAELLAAQLIAEVAIASPIKIAHLAIRLPTIVNRLRVLISACEAMLERIVSTEGRLVAGMALEVGSGAGLMANPPVKISSVLDLGKTSAPNSITTIADRLSLLDHLGKPTLSIEKYGDSAIAYIPGTQTASFGWSNNPMDMKTNLQEMSGQRSNVEVGLEQALKSAGVKPSDRVMLVGHSQGGMVAVSVAERSKAGTFPYKVEKVITFGSPVGGISAENLPEVLSVENKFDFVPKIDGSGNSPAPNWQTLEGEVQGNPVSTHLMEAYQEISRQIAPKANSFVKFATGEGQVSYFQLTQGPDMRG